MSKKGNYLFLQYAIKLIIDLIYTCIFVQHITLGFSS